MIKLTKGLSSQLFTSTQRTFALNEKAVKNRMKAVGSIKKITKAMKMVATSKMKTELARLTNGKNFGFGLISKIFENDPYVRKKDEETVASKVLLVPITTDRFIKKRSLWKY